jgi:hypothetical protein
MSTDGSVRSVFSQSDLPIHASSLRRCSASRKLHGAICARS